MRPITLTRSVPGHCRAYGRLGEALRSKIGSLFSKAEDKVVDEAIPSTVEPISVPSSTLPSTLSPAQYAFLHRVGIQEKIPHASILPLFHHPHLKQLNGEEKARFFELRVKGTNILHFFVGEYIQSRFPRLPKESRNLAKAIYTSKENLYLIAKSIGLEYAIIHFEGLPHVHMQPIDKLLRKERSNITQVLSETFLALLGLCYEEAGLAQTRTFLDAFLFSATFDTKLLCKPKYPIVTLARALRAQGRPQPTFRLLHESGRTSNSSMFVIGAFSENELLAEGYGASINLAEHRAAIEALRAMYLVDRPKAPRPSDALFSEAKDTTTKFSYEAILTSLK